MANFDRILAAVKNRFQNKPVLVVGDILLDIYLEGNVNRICPEGPVPVVHLQKKSWCAGGAANVAVNLACLGLQVQVAGFCGYDEEGDNLIDVLQNSGVQTEPIVRLKNWTTITKTRVFSDNHLMLRLDNESPVCCSKGELEGLYQRIDHCLHSKPLAAVILSDYAKGVLSQGFCKKIIATASQKKIPVLVDPKGKDYQKYAGATFLCPNRSEIIEAAHPVSYSLPDILDASMKLRRQLSVENLITTLSEQGIAHICKKETTLYPAVAKDVFDVSGAGDTVIASIAAGLAAELELPDILTMANIAAGVVVAKVGVQPIKTSDFIHSITKTQGIEQSEKICTPENLLAKVALWRSKGRQIVFTNGCFDLLHAGHVSYLEKARKYGDKLIIGLNTDRSIRELKGAARPVIQEQDRARVLAALASVDAVILFDEPTPMDLIRSINPDYLAKGADYSVDQVVGGEYVKSRGGKVVLVPLVEGKSSSSIIKRVNGKDS